MVRPVIYLDPEEVKKTVRFCHNANDTVEKLAESIIALYTDGKKMRDPT